MERETLEKLYAGLIGMDAGMRLGAPVENPFWTYERLQSYYGDIRGYLREQRYYTADDDVNGPLIFVRALADNAMPKTLAPETVGETWLNYTRRGMGMFWWGGEDVSTEHRAYMNLRRGVKAPRSGSIGENGKTAAEQIGGQIFVDTWGLICPGDPARAAELAAAAASVSHGGSGVDGARFMAACVAAAYTASSLDEVLDAGLRFLPEKCDYRRVVETVRAYHRAHPAEADFRACREMIAREFSDEEYPGGYHIVPNAGICILAMLYGRGELGRSIEISVMCGYDTDCNASNIGTILGVLGGLGGVPERYRRPINDLVTLSSVSGYLNLVDLSDKAKELGALSCRMSGGALPEDIVCPKPGELRMDFPFPGSTHGLELSDKAEHTLRIVPGKAHSGAYCAELMTDGKRAGPVDLSFKAMLTRPDLHEERYDPVFTAKVNPGQRVGVWMKSEQTAPAAVTVTPFVRRAMTGERVNMPAAVLPEGEWTEIVFTVPELGGDAVHDVGWTVETKPDADPWVMGRVYVDEITVTGAMDYAVDFSLQRKEFSQLTPFAFNDCTGKREGNAMRLTAEALPYMTGAQAFTGNYYLRDTAVTASVTVESGGSALVLLRGQGTRRYYALGFSAPGECAVLRYEDGRVTKLAAAPFVWQPGREYALRAEAKGEVLTLFVNGTPVLEASDSRYAHGMPGLGLTAAGETLWRALHISGEC